MRMLRIATCCLAGIWSALSLPVSARAESLESLKAGAFAQDITPQKFPISVNGNMTDVQATEAHDKLYARCIVLKNGETSLAIVICDSCAIPRALMDEAKSIASLKTGIKDSQILIAATHAHSCPTVTPIFQSEPDEEYCQFLIQQIANGIERANDQAEPARIGWGSIDQRQLLFNRRWILDSEQVVENPFGNKGDRILTNPGHENPKVRGSINLIDPQLSFVSIQARDGRPIALLANYSLHYVGGVPSGLVSADYFGEFSTRVARQLKANDVQPPFVAMMSNGTSGDVNNVDFRLKMAPKREPFEQIEYVAELLAQNVAKALEKVKYVDEVPLRMRQTEVVVGVRKPVPTEVKAAEATLEAATDTPLKSLSDIYARETKLLDEYPTSFRIKIQAIRIGTLAIAACPCEVFAETGLMIKKRSPMKSTFTISLANGYNGYLPPPEQLLAGGYESWRARSSYLATDTEPKIRETVKKILTDVSK